MNERSCQEPHMWGDFPNTVLYFRGATSITIDLRSAITARDREALIKSGLEQSFGILTAQNPRGEKHVSHQNAALAHKLRRELDSARTYYIQVDACSPDHSHCEESVAVSLSRSELITIASRYHQLAIFWFDGDRFWIVPALSDVPAVSLPLDAVR